VKVTICQRETGSSQKCVGQLWQGEICNDSFILKRNSVYLWRGSCRSRYPSRFPETLFNGCYNVLQSRHRWRMSDPLENNQFSARDGSRRKLTDLQGHNGILPAVKYKGRNGDIGEGDAGVSLVGVFKQPGCCRSSAAAPHTIGGVGKPSGYP